MFLIVFVSILIAVLRERTFGVPDVFVFTDVTPCTFYNVMLTLLPQEAGLHSLLLDPSGELMTAPTKRRQQRCLLRAFYQELGVGHLLSGSQLPGYEGAQVHSYGEDVETPS